MKENRLQDNFKKLVKQEIYKNLLKMQMEQLNKPLKNEADVSYKDNKKTVVESDKKCTEHIAVDKELECKQSTGKSIIENTSAHRVEDEVFERNEKLVASSHAASEPSKECSSSNLECTRRKEEISAADLKPENEPECTMIEIESCIELEHEIDKYLSTLPQYYEYKTMVRVPKYWSEDESSDSCSERPEISDALSDQESTSQKPEEGESSIAQSQSTNEMNSPTENSTDSKTTDSLKNEESSLKKSNLSVFDIKEYLAVVRQKYEIAKEKREEKSRSYRTLENERLKCQERIEKEIEMIRRFDREQRSKNNYKSPSPSSGESSDTESTDDEVFERRKITKKVPKSIRNKAIKDEIITAERRRAEKRKYKKSRLSPVLVYHYYRPIPQRPGKEETNSDVKDIRNTGPEPSSSQTTLVPRKKIGPRTPPPQDSSSSSDEMSGRISDGGKSNRSWELTSEAEIREPVLKHPRKEDILKSVFRNTKKSENKTRDQLKKQNEPMIDTRAFDATSNTKSKSVSG